MPRRLALLMLLALSGGVAAQEPKEGPVPQEVWLHRPLMRAIAAPEATLQPFVSDGCSGGMSDLWAAAAAGIPAFHRLAGATPPWENCCNIHDSAYHNAGGAGSAEESAVARLTADTALRDCLVATSPDAEMQPAFDAIGDAMFNAVRLGGAPCTGLSWRWGYGWPHCFRQGG